MPRRGPARLAPLAPLVLVLAFGLTALRRRWGGAVHRPDVRVRRSLRVHASSTPRRVTATETSDAGGRVPGDRGDPQGRHGHPQRRACRRRHRPADRPDDHRRRARRAPRAQRARAGDRLRGRHERARDHHRPTRRRRGREPRSRRDRLSSKFAERGRLDPGPRPGRRQGPADPLRAGHRRRGRRTGRVLHRAGGRVAQAPLRRGHQRSAGTCLARPLRLLDRPRGHPARAGHGGLPLRRRRRGVRQGHADQPVPGHVLRLPVGRAGPRLAAVRSVLQGHQPGSHDQHALREGLRQPRRQGLYAYPARWGYWPAAVGLFAFVWLELVYPHSTELGPARLWCAAYLAIMLVGSAILGTSFLERADPFEVYSSLVGKLSIWGHRDGVLLIRSPLANLDSVRPARGPGGRRRQCSSAAPPSTPSGSRAPG